MNINIALIKAVEKHPVLYDKTGSLKQKQKIWDNLEEEFQTPEQSLKSRWYWLLKCFCENPEFIYGDSMSYLLPYFGVKGVGIRRLWPHSINLELYIREEDFIETSSQNKYLGVVPEANNNVTAIRENKSHAVEERSLSTVSVAMQSSNPNKRKSECTDTSDKNKTEGSAAKYAKTEEAMDIDDD